MTARRLFLAFGGLVLVACLFGQGCPGGIGSETLVSQTTSCTIEQDGFCRARVTFTPTEVGSTVNITVTSSLTASRVVFGVDDANGNTVANFTDPVSNVSSDSFQVGTAASHFLTVRELVDPTGSYEIVVIQN